MGLFEREIKDVKRFEQILVILAQEGWGLFLSRLRLMQRVPLLRRVATPRQSVPAPERVRRTFERLGPTFIKFGQILAQRPDIVPQAYIDELEKLEDAVPPFDPDTAREIVEEELGPVDEVFASFEREPLAAASIAQVHRAELPSGEDVVVKVRRPGIKEQMEKDLDILQFLAKRGEKHSTALQRMRASRSVGEFARWTRDELDLAKEARNGMILRENLQDEDRVKVPEIYPDLTTERVLVMEYVEGVKSNDVEALREMDVDAEAVAKTGVRAGLKQVIRDGFFHADPHPSNFLVSPDGKLIYLDFGMVGKFSKTMRRELGLLLLHSLNEDVSGALRTVQRVGTVDDDADIDAFKEDLEELMTTLSHTTIAEQSVVMTLLDLTRRANSHGIHMPSSLTIMGKGLLTMEGIGLTIYPEFEISEEYRRLVKQLLWDLNSPREFLSTLRTDLLENRELFTRLPSKIDDVLTGLSERQVETNVTVEKDRGLPRAVIAGALLIGSTLLLLEALPPDRLLHAALIQLVLAALLIWRL